MRWARTPDYLYEISSEEDAEKISIPMHFVWDVVKGVNTRDHHKIEYFSQTDFGQKLDEEDLEKYSDVFIDIVVLLCDLLKKEKLLSYHLLDTGLDKFALFFERSNSTGMQLDFVDILVTVFSSNIITSRSVKVTK